MNAEQREVLRLIVVDYAPDFRGDDLCKRIERLLAAERESERERCAKIADKTGPDDTTGENVAERIRAAKACGDCPPVGYPTDETRCTPCPRRTK